MPRLVAARARAAHALRRSLQEQDGIDPDDVIMSPRSRAVARAHVDRLLSHGQSRAGGIGHQEHRRSIRRSSAKTMSTGMRGRRESLSPKPRRSSHQERARSAQGDVIVLICSGPAGAGMQEIYQITSALKQLPHCKHVAVLTDARFSGVSTGACIGHISPEALAGGPIGKVREGDQIEIVIDRDALTGSVNLVGEGERKFWRGRRRAAAGAARSPRADLRPHPDSARRHAPVGRAGAGQRRRLGRLRLRCGSDCFAIGEESVKLYRTSNGNFVEDRRQVLSRSRIELGCARRATTICTAISLGRLPGRQAAQRILPQRRF